jgi:hypothetical protein
MEATMSNEERASRKYIIIKNRFYANRNKSKYLEEKQKYNRMDTKQSWNKFAKNLTITSEIKKATAFIMVKNKRKPIKDTSMILD